jgi:Sel1 repeat
MKCFLVLTLLLLTLPVCAQTDDATNFKRRLDDARRGDADAQDDVGVMYAEATGVKRNYRKAVFWLQKSADQGNVLGACNLALHYARGQGLRKNPILALKWAFISHSLDGLKCAPDDFTYFFRPRKSAVKKAWSLADAFLKSHPELTNEFGERPWLKPKTQPNKSLDRSAGTSFFNL